MISQPEGSSQQQSGTLPCTPRGPYSTSHELCTRFALVMFDYDLLQVKFIHMQCRPGSPEPVKYPWRISIIKSLGFDNIFNTTRTKKNATNPCVYVMRYTAAVVWQKASMYRGRHMRNDTAYFTAQSYSLFDSLKSWKRNPYHWFHTLQLLSSIYSKSLTQTFYCITDYKKNWCTK